MSKPNRSILEFLSSKPKSGPGPSYSPSTPVSSHALLNMSMPSIQSEIFEPERSEEVEIFVESDIQRNKDGESDIEVDSNALEGENTDTGTEKDVTFDAAI